MVVTAVTITCGTHDTAKSAQFQKANVYCPCKGQTAMRNPQSPQLNSQPPNRRAALHKQAPCPPRSKAARSGATWRGHGAGGCNRSGYSRPIARICDFSCVLQLSERAKRLPQKLHLNGSWPVWLRQWRFRWLLWVKDRGHMRHLYGRSASWLRRRVRQSTDLPRLLMFPLARSAVPSAGAPMLTSSE